MILRKTKFTRCVIILLYNVEKRDKLALLVPRSINLLENIMTNWKSPSATEMRFGFEITMYVMNN